MIPPNAEVSSFPSAAVKMPAPTADPVLITKAAVTAVEDQVYDGITHARAWVMLTDLRSAGSQPQLPEFGTAHEDRGIGKIMGEVRDKFGRHSMGLGLDDHGTGLGDEAQGALTALHHRMGPTARREGGLTYFT